MAGVDGRVEERHRRRVLRRDGESWPGSGDLVPG